MNSYFYLAGSQNRQVLFENNIFIFLYKSITFVVDIATEMMNCKGRLWGPRLAKIFMLFIAKIIIQLLNPILISSLYLW